MKKSKKATKSGVYTDPTTGYGYRYVTYSEATAKEKPVSQKEKDREALENATRNAANEVRSAEYELERKRLIHKALGALAGKPKRKPRRKGAA